jgi:NAD(P)-dependent dehydrogenase (short-subunit alcohol dehydrogenase family)
MGAHPAPARYVPRVPRSVLITGASSGIGAAAARRLAEVGWSVWGTSRNPDDLGPDAPAIRWVPLELRDEATIQRAVASVLEQQKQLDAVVCNAGIGIFGSLEETSMESARMLFDANVLGTLATLRAALPSIRRAKGRVVLVGSLAGRAPIPFQSHYSAAKAATDAMAQSLANELHAHGAHVSLIEPGDMQTAFNDTLDFEAIESSAYGAPMERCREVIRASLVDAPSPDAVAGAIERALTARRPRFRYAVGKEALAVALGRRLLPDRLALRFVRGHFRL